MNSNVSINGGTAVPGTLEVEIEQVDVTLATKTKPDPAWEYADQQGHFHAWADNGDLPTLTARTVRRDCAGVHLYGLGDTDCCEGSTVTVYACSICGQTVEPATISSPGEPESIPGRMHWSVEVEQHLPNRGEQVSLRVYDRGETLFGIGVVDHQTWASCGPDGVRVWTRIVGAGLLGRRPARQLEAVR